MTDTSAGIDWGLTSEEEQLVLSGSPQPGDPQWHAIFTKWAQATGDDDAADLLRRDQGHLQLNTQEAYFNAKEKPTGANIAALVAVLPEGLIADSTQEAWIRDIAENGDSDFSYQAAGPIIDQIHATGLEVRNQYAQAFTYPFGNAVKGYRSSRGVAAESPATDGSPSSSDGTGDDYANSPIENDDPYNNVYEVSDHDALESGGYPDPERLALTGIATLDPATQQALMHHVPEMGAHVDTREGASDEEWAATE